MKKNVYKVKTSTPKYEYRQNNSYQINTTKNAFNYKNFEEDEDFRENFQKSSTGRIIQTSTKESFDEKGNRIITTKTIRELQENKGDNLISPVGNINETVQYESYFDINNQSKYGTRVNKKTSVEKQGDKIYRIAQLAKAKNEAERQKALYSSPNFQSNSPYQSPLLFNDNQISNEFEDDFNNRSNYRYTNTSKDFKTHNNSGYIKKERYEYINRTNRYENSQCSPDGEIISPVGYIANYSSGSDYDEKGKSFEQYQQYKTSTVQRSKGYKKYTNTNGSKIIEKSQITYELEDPDRFNHERKYHDDIKQTYVNRSEIKNKINDSMRSDRQDFQSPDRGGDTAINGKRFRNVTVGMIDSKGPTCEDRKVTRMMRTTTETRKQEINPQHSIKIIKTTKYKSASTNTNKKTNEITTQEKFRAARIIQAWWRRRYAREEEVYDITVKKAVKLQSFIRGFLVRKKVLRYITLAIYYQSFCDKLQDVLCNHVKKEIFKIFKNKIKGKSDKYKKKKNDINYDRKMARKIIILKNIIRKNPRYYRKIKLFEYFNIWREKTFFGYTNQKITNIQRTFKETYFYRRKDLQNERQNALIYLLEKKIEKEELYLLSFLRRWNAISYKLRLSDNKKYNKIPTNRTTKNYMNHSLYEIKKQKQKTRKIVSTTPHRLGTSTVDIQILHQTNPIRNQKYINQNKSYQETRYESSKTTRQRNIKNNNIINTRTHYINRNTNTNTNRNYSNRSYARVVREYIDDLPRISQNEYNYQYFSKYENRQKNKSPTFKQINTKTTTTTTTANKKIIPKPIRKNENDNEIISGGTISIVKLPNRNLGKSTSNTYRTHRATREIETYERSESSDDYRLRYRFRSPNTIDNKVTLNIIKLPSRDKNKTFVEESSQYSEEIRPIKPVDRNKKLYKIFVRKYKKEQLYKDSAINRWRKKAMNEKFKLEDDKRKRIGIRKVANASNNAYIRYLKTSWRRLVDSCRSLVPKTIKPQRNNGFTVIDERPENSAVKSETFSITKIQKPQKIFEIDNKENYNITTTTRVQDTRVFSETGSNPIVSENEISKIKSINILYEKPETAEEGTNPTRPNYLIEILKKILIRKIRINKKLIEKYFNKWKALALEKLLNDRKNRDFKNRIKAIKNFMNTLNKYKVRTIKTKWEKLVDRCFSIPRIYEFERNIGFTVETKKPLKVDEDSQCTQSENSIGKIKSIQIIRNKPEMCDSEIQHEPEANYIEKQRIEIKATKPEYSDSTSQYIPYEPLVSKIESLNILNVPKKKVETKNEEVNTVTQTAEEGVNTIKISNIIHKEEISILTDKKDFQESSNQYECPKEYQTNEIKIRTVKRSLYKFEVPILKKLWLRKAFRTFVDNCKRPALHKVLEKELLRMYLLKWRFIKGYGGDRYGFIYDRDGNVIGKTKALVSDVEIQENIKPETEESSSQYIPNENVISTIKQINITSTKIHRSKETAEEGTGDNITINEIVEKTQQIIIEKKTKPKFENIETHPESIQIIKRPKQVKEESTEVYTETKVETAEEVTFTGNEFKYSDSRRRKELLIHMVYRKMLDDKLKLSDGLRRWLRYTLSVFKEEHDGIWEKFEKNSIVKKNERFEIIEEKQKADECTQMEEQKNKIQNTSNIQVVSNKEFTESGISAKLPRTFDLDELKLHKENNDIFKSKKKKVEFTTSKKVNDVVIYSSDYIFNNEGHHSMTEEGKRRTTEILIKFFETRGAPSNILRKYITKWNRKANYLSLQDKAKIIGNFCKRKLFKRKARKYWEHLIKKLLLKERLKIVRMKPGIDLHKKKLYDLIRLTRLNTVFARRRYLHYILVCWLVYTRNINKKRAQVKALYENMLNTYMHMADDVFGNNQKENPSIQDALFEAVDSEKFQTKDLHDVPLADAYYKQKKEEKKITTNITIVEKPEKEIETKEYRTYKAIVRKFPISETTISEEKKEEEGRKTSFTKYHSRGRGYRKKMHKELLQSKILKKYFDDDNILISQLHIKENPIGDTRVTEILTRSYSKDELRKSMDSGDIKISGGIDYVNKFFNKDGGEEEKEDKKSNNK